MSKPLSNQEMDLLGMGSWTEDVSTFPGGPTLNLGPSLPSSSTITFPDTRPSNGNSASLEAYLNAPRSSQPWSPINLSTR
ncbi:hypothetical protein N7466_005960 [Penicillium verhagenii]|uniref:uncharacterized protein n=1 Tax=Penicillium verhagenii TaxID=1562060 RepID=UPI0025453E70|nr:uncharacterized protein N7466_005960 [Penicillium verhagenii]KAJ5930467.1 hypothetical protein N7466_005960 [Penicillium verhagenii]